MSQVNYLILLENETSEILERFYERMINAIFEKNSEIMKQNIEKGEFIDDRFEQLQETLIKRIPLYFETNDTKYQVTPESFFNSSELDLAFEHLSKDIKDYIFLKSE